MLNSGSKHRLPTLENQSHLSPPWSTYRVTKRKSNTNEDSVGAISGTQKGTPRPRDPRDQHSGDDRGEEKDDCNEMDLASAADPPQAIMAVSSHGSVVGVAIYDPLQGNLSCLQFTDDAPTGTQVHCMCSEQPRLSTAEGMKLLQASSLHYQVLET